MINQKRYLAQIVIEADSPLKVGSGDRDLFLDSPIQKDWNGLPMILGTSITGVLRHSFDDLNPDKKGSFLNQLFGYQERNENQDGAGSRLMISNAHLLNENMEVNEGLSTERTKFLKKFDNLPVRQHTAITDKGVAKEHSKFDEEVVFKGSRFKFEIELISDTSSASVSDKGLASEIDNDEDAWNEIITLISSPIFRLGGGTTKGFGKMKVVSIQERVFEFDKSENDIIDYQNKSAKLDESIKNYKNVKKSNVDYENFIKYNLKITPEDFFLFGAGFGDDEADMTPVKEDVIVWNNNKGKFSEQQILMPATSIKGALSHRTAFHYNKLSDEFADKLINKDDIEKYKIEVNKIIGENNKAVSEIFGIAKDSDEKESRSNATTVTDVALLHRPERINGSKGKILISDMFQILGDNMEKVFDHVKIDRFTGGAMDGALFQEKVVAQKDEWDIEILLKTKEKVDDEIIEIDRKIIEAFELALKDITTGMLPLGGSVMKGHGVFTGSLEIVKSKEVKNDK